MFQLLSDRLQDAFRKLRGHGRVGPEALDEVLREVRLALLEADVNFKVVKEFVARVRERGLGAEVMKSLTPAQQVIKIVREELTELMGGQAAALSFAPSPPTILMLVGLQGSGKTSTCAKLAMWLRKQGKRPLLIAADLQRPAAVDQLKELGSDWGFDVFAGTGSALDVVEAGLAHAGRQGYPVVVIDTAGRLHVDDQLMIELERLREFRPHQILLVVDSMTGQDAVNLASTFDERVGIDGVILTKIDGDARGGAALSVRYVTGKPVRFVSFGERADAFDLFHPDRMAGRILGMGDVLSLIEKAEETVEKEEMEKQAEKMLKADFDLEDFLTQMEQVKKLGPLTQLLQYLPGMQGGKGMDALKVDENQVKRIEAIIKSMTPGERHKPSILDAGRKRRVAQGSGTSIYEVNQLLKSFAESKKMMKKLGDPKMLRKLGAKGLFNSGSGE